MAYPHVDWGDILHIAKCYSCTSTICPCRDIITAVVSRSNAVTMSSTTVEFQCNIHRHSGLHRDEFMGKSLENLRCAHDISTCTNILVTMDQWDHVCSDNPMFVVVGAVNTPNGLDATKGHAGVVPLPSDRTKTSNDWGVKVCELFAGGFSGWTHVCRSLTHIGHDITVVAAVDHDEQCMQAYCQSHHVEHLVEAPNCAWGVHDLPEKIAICAKVEHHEWCHLLAVSFALSYPFCD